MAFTVVAAAAENNYEVTSSSRLNIREAPSTSAAVVGTFESGQQIEVLFITKGWAKVRYNGKAGYVSEKYVAPLPKVHKVEEPREEMPAVEPVAVEEKHPEPAPVPETIPDFKRTGEYEVETPLVMGSSMSDAINLYLAVQGGFGWSNFEWNNGYVNGTMAYSGNILAQLYFEDRVSFIPRNWYSELALGYNKLGAADFDMNYIHASLCPFGYRLPVGPLNVVVKAGVDVSYPINDLESFYPADFQYGVTGGVQIEWRQFAIGCNAIYDFSEVSSECNQTLNNIGVLGTITYKFGKFGHKR